DGEPRRQRPEVKPPGAARAGPGQEKRNQHAQVCYHAPSRPRGEPGMSAASSAPADGRPKVVATYDYCDAQGALLFQTVRLEPGEDGHSKTFRQRRPHGQGGWVWNLQGVALVPYRLPELRAADPDRLVFVVEGEKDVETLRARGLIATTNPMGAGK